jgi:ATP-dependent protease ClpP protease subunit
MLLERIYMAEIRIDGVIGDVFNTADDIRMQIEGLNLEKGDDLVVKINSQGGSVFEGYAIYNYLRTLPVNLYTVGEGLIGSIATLIFLAAPKENTSISEVSMFMIHRALSGEGGNQDELKKQSEILNTIDKTLITVYSDRTGIEPDEVEQMMANETWMSGKESVKLGFVKTLENPISAEVVAKAFNNHITTKNMSLKNLFATLRNEGETKKEEEEDVKVALTEEEIKKEEEEKTALEEEEKKKLEEEEEAKAETVTMEMFHELMEGVSKVASAVDTLMENSVEKASIEANIETKFTALVSGLKKSNNAPIVGESTAHTYVDNYAKHKAEMKVIENKTRNK